MIKPETLVTFSTSPNILLYMGLNLLGSHLLINLVRPEQLVVDPTDYALIQPLLEADFYYGDECVCRMFKGEVRVRPELFDLLDLHGVEANSIPFLSLGISGYTLGVNIPSHSMLDLNYELDITCSSSGRDWLPVMGDFYF